jgi:hypothetical protein
MCRTKRKPQISDDLDIKVFDWLPFHSLDIFLSVSKAASKSQAEINCKRHNPSARKKYSPKYLITSTIYIHI